MQLVHDPLWKVSRPDEVPFVSRLGALGVLEDGGWQIPLICGEAGAASQTDGQKDRDSRHRHAFRKGRLLPSPDESPTYEISQRTTGLLVCTVYGQRQELCRCTFLNEL